MDEITIVKKPDNISYEVIRDVMQAAHAVHHAKGIFMRVPEMSAEELEKRIGKDGVCYVALKDGKVVGTVAYRYKNIKKWYHSGRIMEATMLSVLPSFQGMHLFARLHNTWEEEAVQQNLEAVTLSTAEMNTIVADFVTKRGFIKVGYKWNRDHYSVYFVKWLHGCPYPKMYCAFRFYSKKLMVKLKRGMSRLKQRIIG